MGAALKLTFDTFISGLPEPKEIGLWGKAVAFERNKLCKADRCLAAFDRQLQLEPQGAGRRGELGSHDWKWYEGSIFYSGIHLQSEQW